LLYIHRAGREQQKLVKLRTIYEESIAQNKTYL